MHNYNASRATRQSHYTIPTIDIHEGKQMAMTKQIMISLLRVSTGETHTRSDCPA